MHLEVSSHLGASQSLTNHTVSTVDRLPSKPCTTLVPVLSPRFNG